MSEVVETFTITKEVDVPGEDKKSEVEIELAVLNPTAKDWQEAKKVYNTTFTTVVTSGGLVRESMDADFMKKQGLWDEKKEEKLQELQRELLDREKVLATGGIKLSEGRKIALEMRDYRNQAFMLRLPTISVDSNSAQGQADDEQFNCLVSRCLVYNDTKKPYFKSLEDLKNNKSSSTVIKASNILSKKLHGAGDDFQLNYPENKFLIDFGFCDKKLRLINKEGKFVDEDYNLVNEKGELVDKDNNRIDKDGNLLTDEGRFKVTKLPFLDDDGEEVENNWSYEEKKKNQQEE